MKNIFANPAAARWRETARVALRNPAGGELTGSSAAYALPPIQTRAPPVLLVSSNSLWKYLDDGSNQGTAWRGTNFNDAAWSSGLAQLGFGDNDEATRIRQTNTVTGTTNITFYFRRAFNVTNAAASPNLSSADAPG